MNELIKRDGVVGKIYLIRGVQVMQDSDLAELYGVETKILNQAVSRNIDRFPGAFRFRLTKEEYENLRSQNATSSLRSQSVTFKSRQRATAEVSAKEETLFCNQSLGVRIENGYNLFVF